MIPALCYKRILLSKTRLVIYKIKGQTMKKIVLITAILGTTLFANMATSVVKHEVKSEKHDAKHKAKKDGHKVDKTIKKEKRKIKKEKRKMEAKAVKAVL